MKERPIIFSGPMIPPILADTKTQTRRIVKPRADRDFGPRCRLQPHEIAGEINAGDWRNSAYGAPGDRLREMNVETTMNDIERYEQAKLAVDAGSALYLLEAAATLLEQLPHVDSRLHRLESTLTKRLREEQQRMLDVMDRAHSKAGTPRPWPR